MDEEKSYFRMSGLRQKGTEKQQNMETLGKIFTDTFHFQSHVKDSLIGFARNINTRYLNLMLLAIAIDSCNTLLVTNQQLTHETFAQMIESHRLFITKETANFPPYHYELYSYIMLVIESNQVLQKQLVGLEQETKERSEEEQSNES